MEDKSAEWYLQTWDLKKNCACTQIKEMGSILPMNDKWLNKWCSTSSKVLIYLLKHKFNFLLDFDGSPRINLLSMNGEYIVHLFRCHKDPGNNGVIANIASLWQYVRADLGELSTDFSTDNLTLVSSLCSDQCMSRQRFIFYKYFWAATLRM